MERSDAVHPHNAIKNNHKSQFAKIDSHTKNWTYLIETLKHTVDRIYEECRVDQSIIECKEAHMYLSNSMRDFETLIESINVELIYETTEKPQAVAWEVRKTITSPTKCLSPPPNVDESDSRKISNTQIKATDLAVLTPKKNDDQKKDDSNDGWNLVTKKRNRANKNLSVYERLASSPIMSTNESAFPLRRPASSGRLTCPRSAMDLPQTKASMAKMAYSRQLLWQRQRTILAEKLERRRRPTWTMVRKAVSTANFSDAYLESRRLATMRESGGDSLESIKELPNELPPSDPTPSAIHVWSRSEPMPELSTLPMGLDDDDAWKAMTEEEESLAQVEQSLREEIEEEENISIDVELERQVSAEADELERLQKIAIPNSSTPKKPPQSRQLSWQNIVDSWAMEMGSNLGELVEQEGRRYQLPGQGVQMHAKLSSTSRKRNPEEAAKKAEERAIRAEELRQQLQAEKTKRLKELLQRVEDVRRKREEIIEKKRVLLLERMEKATEKRRKNIDDIVRKAKDDDLKVQEINFINNLCTNIARHDLLARQQDQQQRVRILHEERQKRHEEKAAKEIAAELRRKTADAERLARLDELTERKTARSRQLRENKAEQERQRVDGVMKRLRSQQRRWAEKKALEEVDSRRLKLKIQQKVDRLRRYQHTLQTVKLRASELATAPPRPFGLADWSRPPSSSLYLVPKMCIPCRVTLPSDLHLMSHVCSLKHCQVRDLTLQLSEESLKVDIKYSIGDLLETVQSEQDRIPPDPDKNRQKQSKKRRQKLRQKIVAKSKEFESAKLDGEFNDWSRPSANKSICDRSFQELNRIRESSSSFTIKCDNNDVHSLERALGAIGRAISAEAAEAAEAADDSTARNFWTSGAFESLLTIVKVLQNDTLTVPSRTCVKASLLLTTLCSSCPFPSLQLLFSSRVLLICDVLLVRFKTLSTTIGNEARKKTTSLYEECTQLALLLSTIFRPVLICDDGDRKFSLRMAMLSSYLVLSGLVDSAFLIVQSGLDLESNSSNDTFLSSLIDLFISLLHPSVHCDHLSSALRDSALLSLPSLVYTQVCQQVPLVECPLVILETFRLFSSLAVVDRAVVNQLLNDGGETAVEFAHTFAAILTCFSCRPPDDQIHRTLIALGHFALLNESTQNLTLLGRDRSLLRQLTTLPFIYFSEPTLIRLLFPTLISICFHNSAAVHLMKQELSPMLLCSFLREQLTSVDAETLLKLENRFPRKYWSDAATFFETNS